MAVSRSTPGEDTIDLQLTPSQQRHLAEAADPTAAPLPVADSPTRFDAGSSSGDYIHRRTARIDLICTITFAVALLGVSAAAIWHPATSRAPAVAAVATGPASAPAPAEAPVALPAVRVQNPFDAGEVFQFPAGTSEVDAHDAVAALLLERARERRDHRPDRGVDPDAPGTRPDILVSRLSEAEGAL